MYAGGGIFEVDDMQGGERARGFVGQNTRCPGPGPCEAVQSQANTKIRPEGEWRVAYYHA